MIEIGMINVNDSTVAELELNGGLKSVEFKVRGQHGVFVSHLKKFDASFTTGTVQPSDMGVNFMNDNDTRELKDLENIKDSDKTSLYFKCESGATAWIEYLKLKIR